ncbi:hypothetical protein SFRURICE_010444 [Spodoptera frugiperda]|nr:hypothetical protein SFRURICE_010444 [Spodoptera frugiperda]
MRHCEACNTDIINNNCIKCTRCIKQYQKLCISFSDEDLQNEKTLNNWLCPHCRSKQPKGNNSNTPIRPSTPRSTAEITFNVTRRKGKQAREINEEIKEFKVSMNFLNNEFVKLKVDNTLYRKEINQMRKENEMLRFELIDTRKNMITSINRYRLITLRYSAFRKTKRKNL